ncbi:MAG: PEP/pyruvate-binding domain-containing protein, partial [Bacillota bacterium]
RFARQHQGMPAQLAEQISLAYQQLGGGSVAVRSSATAEDLSEASMAGQYETFLDIVGEQSLLDAIHKCWASLDTPRTRTYLAEHGIELSQVAMAVVVQKLVPAEVAGVLFCANPRTGSRNEMLIEASWGLGEAVVSGRVQPDVLKIDTATGQVLLSRIADKQLCIRPGDHAERPVDESLRTIPCLHDADVTKLWELGRQATEHFGAPQDIEWALHQGQLFLLQSRPITTLAGAEAYEHVLQSTRQHLLQLIDHGHGPWVLHNIAETLPHPTPLTWSVIQRFMSGTGGFGAMYKRAGFEPSPKVAAEGFLHRLAGKVYMDLSLAAEMFFADYPYQYDLDELRQNPDAAQSPPTLPAGSLGARAAVGRRIARINRNLHDLAQNLDRQLRQETIPSFEAWCRQEKQRNLSALLPEQLIPLWQERQRRVMDEFAPQSLLPSLILAMALADLRAFLNEQFWDDEPDALAAMLSSGHAPDKTVTANAQLREVSMGTRRLEDWLADYGHRAPDEFDLATPRWRDRPDELLAMAHRLKDGADPLRLHEERQQRTHEKLEQLRSQLSARDRKELDARLDLVWRYLPFREDGKYYLMLGYDLLRDVALEAGRRLGIDEDVFQLSLEELHVALNVRANQQHLIDERKAAYEAERRVALPRIIDRESLQTLGEAPAIHPAGSHPAYPVSTGSATGPARVVRSPKEAGDLGSNYILVCPSTDPGWTPLFVNAAGLILECGGTLSHGAVIAREMNIPAVVLAGATELFKDGEIISVDGRNGLVTRPTESTSTSDSGEAANPDDVQIPRAWVPPAPGRKERAGARLRNLTGLIWGVYLIAAYTLPANWVWQPSLRGLDWMFWPMVRALGKPATVAIVSASLAALTMIVQKWLTDNGRLLEAKRRARLLLKEAAQLPKRCKRRYAMEDLAAAVQMRVALAAFVPLAVLLGPMVMTFA